MVSRYQDILIRKYNKNLIPQVNTFRRYPVYIFIQITKLNVDKVPESCRMYIRYHRSTQKIKIKLTILIIVDRLYTRRIGLKFRQAREPRSAATYRQAERAATTRKTGGLSSYFSLQVYLNILNVLGKVYLHFSLQVFDVGPVSVHSMSLRPRAQSRLSNPRISRVAGARVM